MTHELKDSVELLFIIITGFAAVIVPIMMKGDAKRASTEMKQAFAVDWGELTERVKGQGETLAGHSEILQEHTKDIGYLKGRVNGASAGRSH